MKRAARLLTGVSFLVVLSAAQAAWAYDEEMVTDVAVSDDEPYGGIVPDQVYTEAEIQSLLNDRRGSWDDSFKEAGPSHQEVVAAKDKKPKNQVRSKGDCGGLRGANCELFKLTNRARAAEGLPALKIDDKCQTAAQKHAEDMANRRYYNHMSPEGKGLAERYDGRWYTIGENIMMGKRTDNAGAIRAWLGSKGHRKNLLSESFTSVGIGIAKGNGNTYFVQCFSRPYVDPFQ